MLLAGLRYFNDLISFKKLSASISTKDKKKGGDDGLARIALLKVGSDLWSSEVVDYDDVDDDADQASRETKDPCDNAEGGEDHGDGSSPGPTIPQAPRHDESQYSEYE